MSAILSERGERRGEAGKDICGAEEVRREANFGITTSAQKTTVLSHISRNDFFFPST